MGGPAKLVLLDAGAVFGALEHDEWEGLTNASTGPMGPTFMTGKQRR